MPAPGSLACTAKGGAVINVEAETCWILPEDARSLIFSGQPAPVLRSRSRRDNQGAVTGEVTIEGHAALHPAGRAVVIQTREGCWLVPLVTFRRVVSGEAASAPLFPISSGAGL